MPKKKTKTKTKPVVDKTKKSVTKSVQPAEQQHQVKLQNN